MIAVNKKITKNVDNWLKFPIHPLKSLYCLCISRGTLHKSMTMVYKFIVKLFSKPQKLYKLGCCENNFEIKDKDNYLYF